MKINKINKITKKEEANKKPLEQSGDLKRLLAYMVIVDYGQGDAISKLFKSKGSAAQITSLGRGTAGKNVQEILGIIDNRKEVVLAMVKNESIPDIMVELEAFFAISKKNRGIAFTIPLTSLVGVKLYHFFTNTI